MVEQNAYAALRIADFGYVMQNGQVVRSGPTKDLLDLEALRRGYFTIGGPSRPRPPPAPVCQSQFFVACGGFYPLSASPPLPHASVPLPLHLPSSPDSAANGWTD